MPAHLCITIRFLGGLSHGRGDGGEPEWPPSPLRVYQSLVNAAAGRWNERVRVEHARAALEWLERQKPPVILAGVGEPAQSKYRLYVPDNVADKVAGSWSRGNDASIADYRAEKDVRPLHLSEEAVHYLYPLADNDAEFDRHRDVLRAAARSVTHLGWGIDMVVGDASVVSDGEAALLSGERWTPSESRSGTNSRTPTSGTLEALSRKHQAFLNRLTKDGFQPVPPLTRFKTISYRRATDPDPCRWVAFKILAPDGSGDTRAFDPPDRTRVVAGWMRAAVAEIAKNQLGWSDEEIARYVHGKTPDGVRLNGGETSDRFSYIPLPTINYALNRAESNRRILIAAPPHWTKQIDAMRRSLPGAELTCKDGHVQAFLSPAIKDWVVDQYTGSAKVWSTVTPVILPGYDDNNCNKAERLLWKSFEQAGLSPEFLTGAEVDWRRVGFRAGVDLAHRYLPPRNLDNKSRYHVRVVFKNDFVGPLVIGAGRFRGFGLFAIEDQRRSS